MSKKNKINKSIYSLISNVNKKARVGFFNFCPKLNTIFYSYKISVKGQNYITLEQVQDFIDLVTSECDRFFPVFFVFFYKNKIQFMLWKSLFWIPVVRHDLCFNWVWKSR